MKVIPAKIVFFFFFFLTPFSCRNQAYSSSSLAVLHLWVQNRFETYWTIQLGKKKKRLRFYWVWVLFYYIYHIALILYIYFLLFIYLSSWQNNFTFLNPAFKKRIPSISINCLLGILINQTKKNNCTGVVPWWKTQSIPKSFLSEHQCLSFHLVTSSQ